MRRMLDPKEVGGGGSLPSTIEFDKDGNREVKKNLKVDGKLTLPSLVSESNPDGDITKELGSSARHGYSIFVQGRFHYEVYTTKDYDRKIGEYKYIANFNNDNYKELRYIGNYPACGFWKDSSGSKKEIIFRFKIDTNNVYSLFGYDVVSGTSITEGMYSTALDVVNIIKLF